jgi:DNA polymerase-3 subunit gamma/tau
MAGDEERATIERQAHAFTLPAVLHVITQLQQCLERMSMGSNRRVEMEVTLIRLCSPALDTTGDAMVRRLEQVEQDLRRVEIKAAAAPAADEDDPPVRKKKKAVETKEPMPAPSMEGLPAPIQTEEMAQWEEVLEALHTLSPSLAAYMHGSRAFIDGKYCLIDAPNSMAFEMLRNIPAQKDKMRDAIRSVTGKTYKLGPYKGSATQKKKESDPLEQIAAMAREMEIPLTETLLPAEEQ